VNTNSEHSQFRTDTRLTHNEIRVKLLDTTRTADQALWQPVAQSQITVLTA
jgi:hypothetical protein